MKIYKIVLTGGPRSGKTSVLKKLIEHYKNNKNVTLITVPETATLLKDNGINPETMGSIYDFQNLLFRMQYMKECEAERVAVQAAKNNDVIIVYDRGLFDNKAYLETTAEFESILKENSVFNEEIELLDRYDLIINLKTTAGTEFGYECDSNKIRDEKEEDAVTLDIRTTEAWLGHKNIKIVQPTETIEEKMEIVYDLINNLRLPDRYTEIEEVVNTNYSFDPCYSANKEIKSIGVVEYELDFEMRSGFKHKIYERRSKNNKPSYVLELSRQVGNIKQIDRIKQIDEETAYQFINQLGIKSRREKSETYYYHEGAIHRQDTYYYKYYEDGMMCMADPFGPSHIDVVEYDMCLNKEERQKNKVLTKLFENSHIIC